MSIEAFQIQDDANRRHCSKETNLTIKIVSTDGTTLYIIVNKTTIFRYIIDAYCKIQGLPRESVYFVRYGFLVREDESAEENIILDGVVIDALRHVQIKVNYFQGWDPLHKTRYVQRVSKKCDLSIMREDDFCYHIEFKEPQYFSCGSDPECELYVFKLMKDKTVRFFSLEEQCMILMSEWRGKLPEGISYSLYEPTWEFWTATTELHSFRLSLHSKTKGRMAYFDIVVIST